MDIEDLFGVSGALLSQPREIFEEKKARALALSFNPESILFVCGDSELVLFVPRTLCFGIESFFPKDKGKRFYAKCDFLCPLCYSGIEPEWPPEIVEY